MHRMHSASSGGFGEVSEYNPMEDFDLFWGMGPSRYNSNQNDSQHNNPIAHQQQQQQQPHHQQQLDVVGSVSSGISVAPSHSSGGSAGGSGLNSSNLSIGGGGLWVHSTEAYGHRHHLHLQDVSLKDPGIVGSNTTKSLMTSPKRAPAPSPHRAAWPSPSHTSSSRNGSPLQMRQQRHPTRSLDIVINSGHDNNSNMGAGTGVSGRLAAPAASAESDHASRSSNNRSIVDSKVEELAAAITSSVLGKLDIDVREALLSQKHHQQQHRRTHAAPHTQSSSAYASSETAATVMQLRSRLTALEEQVVELKATIESKPTKSPSFSQRSLDDDGSIAGENEPRIPLASRGPQGSSGSRGGGRAVHAGANSGNGGDRDMLEQSLAALAQRTGTLEGRHKQVQAKVALLDSAFGSKASDWAQTVRDILIEREVAAATAGGGGTGIRGVTPIGRATGKGSKKSSANSTATSASTSQSSSQGDESVNNRLGSGGTGPNSSNKSGAKQVATARGAGSTKGADGGNRTSNKSLSEITPHANGQSPQNPQPELVESTGQECDIIRVDKGQANRATIDRSSSRSRCAACADTEARCNQLEARVFESEGLLAMLQKQADEVTGQAAAAAKAAKAAAAAAEIETAKAAEAAASSAASAAVAGKAAADAASTAETMVATKRDADASLGEAAGGACSGRHPQKSAEVATVASLGAVVDKLAGDLKLLSERTKEREDALALVDHGLKGIRDQVSNAFSCA